MPRTPPSGTTVQLEHLTCAYGKTVALDRLDLTIESGEFFTLLGPSGSGKTTTLMLIAGFAEPSAGEIRLDGAAVSKAPPHQRDIGVVFQNYSLFPHMSVAGNIAFPLELRGVSSTEIEDRVQAMLNRVGLSRHAGRMPHELSGGQQQRVALARALVFEPGLLLLDEPFSALDPELRTELQSELLRLHEKTGTTILCVTHDQSEALALSDRIAVLNNGKLEQTGTPVDMYEHPENAFVARFIGDCNLLQGRVRERIDDRVLVELHPDFTVHAQASETLKPGQECQIMVRPHRIRLGASTEGTDNRYKGRLTKMVYAGDTRFCHVELQTGNHLRIALPEADIPNHPQAVNAETEIGFDAKHAIAFSLDHTSDEN
ncbi:ABC transporter ATP-binding protein [Elongatibacter sediminis]|uniref:ABC transporter ATP-binding protein n=1 Tax=Elongatibacter sediminis TaxID=3119006 RepID=A0AAW9R5Y7_9GAMM